MKLRRYTPTDCKELAELFYQTVHHVNAKDYTEEQLNAWATGKVDLDSWNESFCRHYSIVATEGNRIVGFGDMDATGYLDRLYVHKDYQGRGIATAICNNLESSVAATTFTTHASITSKPFFEQRGYQVIRENQVIRQGIILTNYIMEKRRSPLL